MAKSVRLVEPNDLHRNPENPRLIFRQEDLDALQESINEQGILVPLTVFEDSRSRLILLDGERRWRCALKLGLRKIPVIVQPQPSRLQNIMMMFAIHNARKDWDPLPTALKLEQLEEEFARQHDRHATEQELAGLASITRGEVRRLKKLLGLPKKYRHELMEELKKPRSDQIITVDHVLEATRGASALRKRGIVDARQEDRLRIVIMAKFRRGIIKNTVDPRKLARIARAVERDELPKNKAQVVIRRLIEESEYSIDDAFRASVERHDFEHATEQLIERVTTRLADHRKRAYDLGPELRKSLHDLAREIRDLLSS